MTSPVRLAPPSQRGMTLIELMIAGVVVLVAVLGFVGVLSTAASANGIAQRRTVGRQLDSALLDRYAVTARDQLATVPPNAWMIDGCYDGAARLVASNAGSSTTFECGGGTVYRSWLRLEPGANRTWTLRTYAERVDQPCAVADRFTSLSCVAADHLLTD